MIHLKEPSTARCVGNGQEPTDTHTHTHKLTHMHTHAHRLTHA